MIYKGVGKRMLKTEDKNIPIPGKINVDWKTIFRMGYNNLKQTGTRSQQILHQENVK